MNVGPVVQDLAHEEDRGSDDRLRVEEVVNLVLHAAGGDGLRVSIIPVLTAEPMVRMWSEASAECLTLMALGRVASVS